MLTVTSARGSTVKLALEALLVRLGSAVVLDPTVAVFVRLPPFDPGRTVIVTTGQSEPTVQTGSVLMLQVWRMLCGPVTSVEQARPVATPGAVAIETYPAFGPLVSLLTRLVSRSVSTTFCEAAGPEFAISMS